MVQVDQAVQVDQEVEEVLLVAVDQVDLLVKEDLLVQVEEQDMEVLLVIMEQVE